MDLGLGFDDSDFEQNEKVTSGTNTSYNAKICKPVWFEDEEGDPSSYRHHLKYSADYHYYQGSYETAATKYKNLLEMIPEDNLPMRQDVLESLSRSYTKLGKHRESTDIAYKLVEIMRNEDVARQMQSLLLLSEACKKACDWTGCTAALEELISQHSNYAQFWQELGSAYQQQLKNGGDNLQHLAQILTCYIRARMLLEAVLHTAGDICRERNEAAICKIDRQIQELEASEQLLMQATEAVQADMDHGCLPADEEEEIVPIEKKWFSWTEYMKNSEI